MTIIYDLPFRFAQILQDPDCICMNDIYEETIWNDPRTMPTISEVTSTQINLAIAKRDKELSLQVEANKQIYGLYTQDQIIEAGLGIPDVATAAQIKAHVADVRGKETAAINSMRSKSTIAEVQAVKIG